LTFFVSFVLFVVNNPPRLTASLSAISSTMASAKVDGEAGPSSVSRISSFPCFPSLHLPAPCYSVLNKEEF
jgi:hypothetical protein